MKLSKLNMSILMIALVSMVSLQAQNVQQDLVGARGSSAETQLQNRGFHHIKTQKYGYNIYSYWWNQGAKSCICERINDGKVKSIVKSLPADCNKTMNGTKNVNNNYNHSSHHYDHNSKYNDTANKNAFERGFNDGQYHKTYDNVYYNANQKSAYSDGYAAGVKERNQNTSYHHNGNYHSGSFVEWDDQVGRDAEDAYRTLERRGFKEVKIAHTGGTTRRLFHHKGTGQCIVTISIDKEIYKIEHSNNCNDNL